MAAILQLQNITKTFGKQHALNHVNLTIQPGDIYGLIGRNGAGKTTIFRMQEILSCRNDCLLVY